MPNKSGCPSDLYYSIAKDFEPKKALMNICRYVEELEARLEQVETAIAASELGADEKAPRKSRKAKCDLPEE